MKRTLRRWTRDHHDHGLATAARVVLGAAGVLAGVMVIRSLPELIRYVKMERM
jgi:hypothetical protein